MAQLRAGSTVGDKPIMTQGGPVIGTTANFSGLASLIGAGSQLTIGSAVDQSFILGDPTGMHLLQGLKYTGSAWEARQTSGAYLVVGPTQLVFSTFSGATVGGVPALSSRMILNTTGMGLGLTPACKLDVAGTVRATTTTVPTSGIGVELAYNTSTGVGSVEAYDRTASTRKKLSLAGETVDLWAMGVSKLAVSSLVNDSTQCLRVTGTSVPTTGAGLELLYSGEIGSILAFDRAGSVFRELRLDGATINIRTSGTTKLSVGGTWSENTQTFRVTALSVPTTGSGLELAYDSANAVGYIESLNRTGATRTGLVVQGSILYLRGNGGTGLTVQTTGLADAAATFRVQGTGTPGSGAGLEFHYTGGTGTIVAYDRTTPGYKDVNIQGSQVQLYSGSTLIAKANGNGLVIDKGFMMTPVVNTANTLTVTANHCVIVSEPTSAGAVTITLPAAPATGQKLIIIDGKGDAKTNNITLDGNGKTIDGVATKVIKSNYGSATIIYSGTAWFTAGGGGAGGGAATEPKVVTALTYTVLEEDTRVFSKPTGAGARTFTLPATPVAGHELVIKDGNRTATINNLTIAGNGRTIDGAASLILTNDGDSATLHYDGTEWHII